MFSIPWPLETRNIFLESHRVLWLLSWWENIRNVKSDWTHCLETIQKNITRKIMKNYLCIKKLGISVNKNLLKFLQQTFWNCCSTHKKLEHFIGNKTNAKFKSEEITWSVLVTSQRPDHTLTAVSPLHTASLPCTLDH